MSGRHPVAVIIGMMGAGKTRVGREVAQMLGLPFLDADIEIEREVGMGIPDYFAQYGEPAFRRVERELVARTLDGFDGIFAACFRVRVIRRPLVMRGEHIFETCHFSYFLIRYSVRY